MPRFDKRRMGAVIGEIRGSVVLMLKCGLVVVFVDGVPEVRVSFSLWTLRFGGAWKLQVSMGSHFSFVVTGSFGRLRIGWSGRRWLWRRRVAVIPACFGRWFVFGV